MPRRDSDTGLRCCTPCFVQSNTNYVLRSTLFPGPWVVQDNSYVSWMRAVSRRAFSRRHIASGRRCWRLLWWVAARAPCGVGGPIVVAGELLRRPLATHSRCSVTPPKTSIPRQRRSKAQHQQRSLASSRPLLAQFSGYICSFNRRRRTPGRLPRVSALGIAARCDTPAAPPTSSHISDSVGSHGAHRARQRQPYDPQRFAAAYAPEEGGSAQGPRHQV